MRILIRYITHRSKGGNVFRDNTLNSNELSVGRAAGQQLFLADNRVALQHALITHVKADQFLIQSRSLSGIRVNQRLLQSTIIKTGDTVRIGYSELRLFEAPEDYDLAIEVSPPQRQQAEAQPTSDLNIAVTKPSLRRWSWFLFVACLILFLAIPAGQQYLRGYYSPWLDKVRDELSDYENDVYFEFPDMPLMISDRFWSSGELSGAHHFFGQICATCHQVPFQRVEDSSCTNCHGKTHPHVDPDFFSLDTLDNTRCAECHHEHNGKHNLIERDDTLCSQCHKDLSQQGVSTELGDAEDFGEKHPPFRLSLLRHDNGIDSVERASWEEEDKYVEQSNLEFSHDVHLDKGGLATIDGVFRLWCEDCHIHEAGDRGMQPINYETMCHNCHPLIFDPANEEREVPHGKRNEVMYTLYEYYSKLALEGGYDDDFFAPEVVTQARFPDEKLEGQARLEALEWARQKAEDVGEEVFEFSVCIECHKVKQISTDPVRWDIAPVRITQNWMPKARFTHEGHKTMDCLFCHAAPDSPRSEDILIPDIHVCQQCHGGVRDSGSRLATTCVDCHGFHVATEFTMKKMEGM
jgi:hypothetical protein